MLELFRRHVAEASRRVVHRSQQHAGERQGHVVGRGDPPAPFVVLGTEHAFLGEEVRPGAVEASGTVGAMQVEHQPVPGGAGHHAVEEGDHFLVVAVHEVDLDALDAHVAIPREDFVHARFQRLPVRPHPDADAALARVFDHRGQVQLRYRAQDVGLRVVQAVAEAAHVPAVVDQHVLQLQRRGVVDVALDRRGVHARVRHVRGQATRPPVPGGLAGADPGRVLDRGGRVEAGDQVGFDQRAGTVAEHQHAPGGQVAAVGDLGTRQAHRDAAFVQARRQARFHAQASVAAAAQVQAGEPVQVRFGDGEAGVAVAGAADQRQLDQVHRPQLRGGEPVVLALVAGAEGAEVEHPAGVVAREQEAGQVLLHHQVAARGQRHAVAQRDAVVVGAQDHAQGAAVGVGQVHFELAVVVARAAGLAGHQFVGAVVAAAARVDHAQPAIQPVIRPPLHAQRRGQQHRLAVPFHRVRRAAFAIQ